MNTRGEAMRKLIDLSISAGRKRQSEQTNFLHLHYHPKGEAADVAIPLLENFLFAWSLFRSRTAENIQEAKSLLDHLLHFEQQGNFPVYLHEFPKCHDRYLAFHVLSPLQGIYNQFQTILGQELKDRLQQKIQALKAYVMQTQASHPAPFPIALRGHSAVQEARPLVERLCQENRHRVYGPADLGVILSAFYTMGSSLQDSPWRDLWGHINATWHATTATYIGPGIAELQQGYEPQATLYDLYLGYLSDGFSQRALADGVHLLHAAYVLPTGDKVTGQENPYAYALLERKAGWNPATDRSFIPLKLMWGNVERTHTLVCQGGNLRTMQYSEAGNRIELTFELADPIQQEDREKMREIAFYLDDHDNHSITFSGQTASTFKLHDEVQISSKNLTIRKRFALIEGEGQFVGHLMKGNRPAQVSLKGPQRYNAYDWQIFLRTVRRTPRCVVKATIEIEKGSGDK